MSKNVKKIFLYLQYSHLSLTVRLQRRLPQHFPSHFLEVAWHHIKQSFRLFYSNKSLISEHVPFPRLRTFWSTHWCHEVLHRLDQSNMPEHRSKTHIKKGRINNQTQITLLSLDNSWSNLHNIVTRYLSQLIQIYVINKITKLDFFSINNLISTLVIRQMAITTSSAGLILGQEGDVSNPIYFRTLPSLNCLRLALTDVNKLYTKRFFKYRCLLVCLVVTSAFSFVCW